MPATTMMDKANSAASLPAGSGPSGVQAGSGQPKAGQLSNHDLDARARKRMEVGLAPTRPTAKAAPMRPPDSQVVPVPPAALAALLVAIVLVTIVLLAANMSGGLPSWWPTWTGLSAGENRNGTSVTALTNQNYTLRLADDFSQTTSPLMQGNRPNEWRTELRSAESVYTIEVWPNHLAWSLIGLSGLHSYRLQTSVLVDEETPGGYAGLIFRYQDERHFYLLSVDGNGRYQIQQQNGAQVITVQPWVMAPFLNRAGSANLLTIEDDGDTVRFWGNNMVIAVMDDLAYPSGLVGLAAGAQSQAPAEVHFDWFQLYDAVAN